MNKHTPGPWMVTEDHMGEPDRKDVVAVNGGLIATDLEENDARLIAAAPELLEVLKHIVASAPLRGLPLALEKDIQDACHLLTRIQEA